MARDRSVLSRLVDRLAALLIRGPHAPYVAADIEEAMERDLARGVPRWRARWRFAVNLIGSALSLWRARWHQALSLRRPAPGASKARLGGWQLPTLGVSWLDIKLGLRMLRKHPCLTCVAGFALAVGIPVGLAPLHWARALQAPLPFDQSDRIVVLRHANLESARPEAPSLYDFVHWREELTSFEALGVTTIRTSYNVISEDGLAAPVPGAAVTASAFDVLRVAPLMGRTLYPSDEAAGAPEVVVVGFDLWRSRLGGDPGVVGHTIRIGGAPHTIVGVMPKAFRFPFRDQLWLPLRISAPTDEHDQQMGVRLIGRLAIGVSPEEAQAELTTVGQRMAAANPELHRQLRPEVVPFAIGFFNLARGGLQAEIGFYAAQVLTLTLLLVACANVAMLILARTASRSGELAVRTALGANRTRVVSQLFAEALVFAVLAAGAGLWISHEIATRLVVLDFLPFWVDLGVTGETALWALALAAVSAGAVGVVPALKVTGRSVQANLQHAAASRSGIRFGGFSSLLIVANVTLAVATLGVATGFSDTLTSTSGGLGVATGEYLYAELRMPAAGTEDPAGGVRDALEARRATAQTELVRRLVAEPGIRGVAIGSHLPGMDHPAGYVEIEGEEHTGSSHGRRVWQASVDVDFFSALQQPILFGRGFDTLDLGGERSVVIVNTNFVERVLGGRSPIGRRVRYTRPASGGPGAWHEIVGVVGHLGMSAALPGNDAGIYHPRSPGVAPVRLAIHVGDDPESFTPRLRELASKVDPTAMIHNPQTLADVFSFNAFTLTWMKRGAVILIAILVGLSATGLYALMSFTIAQRRREIGIRAALGAGRGSIVSTIARRSLSQLGLGAILGLAIALTLLSELKSDFGRIPTHSPLALALAASLGVVVLVGALACVAPTFRALRIDPKEALSEG